MYRYIKSITENQEGQGLMEYALILSFIAAACVMLVSGVGTSLEAKLNNVVNNMP